MGRKNASGCGGLILAFIALSAFFVYVSGLIIIVDAVVAGLFISNLNSCNALKETMPSLMVCPNCGSNDVMLSTRKAGTSANGHYHHGYYNRESVTRYDRVANCHRCGFVWDYITMGEIIEKRESAKNAVVFYGIVLAACAIFTLKTFGIEFTSQVFA